jgi:hypothetical protein
MRWLAVPLAFGFAHAADAGFNTFNTGVVVAKY